MTINQLLQKCTTVDEFTTFFNSLNWIYPAFGGRRAHIKHAEKAGTLCMNDLVMHIDNRIVHDKEKTLELIQKIRKTDTETRQEPFGSNILSRIVVAIKRALTWVIRLFKNYNYDRNEVLAVIEAKLKGAEPKAQVQPIQRAIDQEPMAALVKKLDLSPDANNAQTMAILRIKVYNDFASPEMLTAFVELKADPERFEWFARYVAWISQDKPLDTLQLFFDTIDWPSSALKEKVLCQDSSALEKKWLKIDQELVLWKSKNRPDACKALLDNAYNAAFKK